MTKRGANRLAGAAAIAMLLAGCTVGPDYHPAEPGALGVPAAYAPPVTRPAPGELMPAEADLSAWWNQLGDPLLTDLIARATAGNLAIAQSVARLGEARESLVQARGDLLPTLGASAGASRNFTRGGASTIVVGGSGGAGGAGGAPRGAAGGRPPPPPPAPARPAR